MACFIPIPAPGGTLFLAEPLLYLLAFVALIRRSTEVVVKPPAALLMILAFWATGLYAIGVHGSEGAALQAIRALLLVVAAILVFANSPRSMRLLRALPRAGALIGILVVAEAATGFDWPGAGESFVGTSARILGPLGPGAVATLLMAGLFVALRWRWRLDAILNLVGIVLVSSRAHYAAVAIMLLLMARPNRTAVRQFFLVAAVIVIVLVAVPQPLQRIQEATSGASASRSEVWDAAIASFDLPVGTGPAAFEYGDLTYAHQQAVTLILYYGVLGGVVLVAVVLSVVWVGRRRRISPLVVAWAVACAFGEFAIGPSIKLALGSLFIWALLSVSEEALAAPSPARRARRPGVTYGGRQLANIAS